MTIPVETRSDQFPIGSRLTLEKIARDPANLTRLLREQEPVSWLPADRTWLVASRDLVEEVVRDQDRFTVDTDEHTDRAVLGRTMLTIDGPEHETNRKPFDPPLRAGHVGVYADIIDARIEEIIAPLVSAGSADVVEDFATPLGLRVVSDVLGFDYPEPDRVKNLLAELFTAMELSTGSDVRVRANEARTAFVPEVLRMLDVARTQAPQSVLGMVANEAGSDVSKDILANNTINLMFGGVETTATLVTTTIWTLLTHPAQLDEVRADTSLISKAIDEAIRRHPAFAMLLRWTTRDTEIGGVPIAAGDRVFPLLIAANRDPSMFENPDAFDIHRANARQNISFGRGLHFCIGQNIARMVGDRAIRAMLSRLPGLRLDEDRPVTHPTGLEFHRLSALPVVWNKE